MNFFNHYLIQESKEREQLDKTIDYLSKKEKVLLLTTSNRWTGHTDDVPKSTQLAMFVQEQLGKQKATLIEVPKLKIYPCEGNISSSPEKGGNHCGTKDAALKDKEKNPTGYHRCWASVNNKDDELWKISKPLFESDAVQIFGSVRWGQTNAYYQKLIERLTWIENRATTLGEKSIVTDIDAGLILIGQNWNGKDVLDTQKQVLEFFGFKTPKEMFWNWQYTQNSTLETKESYKKAYTTFEKQFILED
jgi:multimeric flavodoxin WrbA